MGSITELSVQELYDQYLSWLCLISRDFKILVGFYWNVSFFYEKFIVKALEQIVPQGNESYRKPSVAL